jgi:putative tricarboxylic transport membrane protein
VRTIDRRVGAALALLGAAVLWSARSFPVVPGHTLGAGFLPSLVGAGLLLCGLSLVWRSLRGSGYGLAETKPAASRRDLFSASVIVLAIVAYIALADWLGFLLLAPLCLVAVFLVLGVRLLPALAWALAGTLLVHLAFYKLLRVPLPWGLLRPLY